MTFEVKGLVLAAGFGKRLGPLTAEIPKPLLPFFGVPLIDAVLWRLKEAGVTSTTVNTHYHSEKLRSYLEDGIRFTSGLNITYEPKILGTGGTVASLQPWLQQQTLLIHNADIVSNIDLKKLLTAHVAAGADATMVLVPHDGSAKTPVFSDGSRVLSIGGEAKLGSNAFIFTGIHILSPGFIASLPKGSFDIVPHYRSLLERGGIVKALLHEGFWSDLGEPQSIWNAFRELAQGGKAKLSGIGLLEAGKGLGVESHFFARDREQVLAPAVLADSVFLDPTARVGPWVGIHGTREIPKGASVKESLLLGNVNLKPGEKIYRTLAFGTYRIALE